MARRRALRALLLALTVALIATACSGSGSGDSNGGVAAAGPKALADAKGQVIVTLWHGLGGSGGTAFQKQVDAFNSANSGKIQVKAVFQGSYADTLAKYTAAIRDRSTPSILVTNDVTTGIVRDTGQVVPAYQMATANPDDLRPDDLQSVARSYYSVDGKLIAVPLAVSMPLLYVNDAMLTKAKVNRSSLGTLDGVATAARSIHSTSPSVAGIVEPFDGWWFEQLTAASGQPYCTPDNGRTGKGATALKLTSEPQRKAFGTMAKLYLDGVGLNTGADGNAALSAFAAGKVAMMFNSSGAIGGLNKAGMKGYSALPYPISGPRATSGSVIGGAAMWVSGPGHSAAERVASWKAISYFASAKAQESFSQASGYAPVSTAVSQSPSQQAFLKQNPQVVTLLKQLRDTPTTPATSGCLSGAMTGVRAEVVAQMQSAFSGRTPLDAALTAGQQAATTKITEYRQQAGQ